jgi:hypothetical protein
MMKIADIVADGATPHRYRQDPATVQATGLRSHSGRHDGVRITLPDGSERTVASRELDPWNESNQRHYDARQRADERQQRIIGQLVGKDLIDARARVNHQIVDSRRQNGRLSERQTLVLTFTDDEAARVLHALGIDPA